LEKEEEEEVEEERRAEPDDGTRELSMDCNESIEAEEVNELRGLRVDDDDEEEKEERGSAFDDSLQPTLKDGSFTSGKERRREERKGKVLI
jgi:hypothetical protein